MGGEVIFSPPMATPPGLKGLKTTLTESLVEMGWPFRVAGGEGPGLNGSLGGAGQRWDVTEDLDILDFCGGVETH